MYKISSVGPVEQTVVERIRAFLFGSDVTNVASELSELDPMSDSKTVFKAYSRTPSESGFDNPELEGGLHHTAFRLVGDQAQFEQYIDRFERLGMTVMRRVTVDGEEISRQLATKKEAIAASGLAEDHFVPTFIKTTQGVRFAELSCNGKPPFIFMSVKEPKHLDVGPKAVSDKVSSLLADAKQLKLYMGNSGQLDEGFLQSVRSGASQLKLPLTKEELETLKAADGYIYWTQLNHLMTAMVRLMQDASPDVEPGIRFPLNHHAFRLNQETGHGLKTCDQAVSALRRAGVLINDKFGPDVQVHTEQRETPEGRTYDYTFKQTSRVSAQIMCQTMDGEPIDISGNYTEWVEHPKDELTGADLPLEKFYGFLFLFMSTIKDMSSKVQ